MTLDLRGQRFTRLIAIESLGLTKQKRVLWKCICDCGNFHNVPSNALRSGNTKSCGCLKDEILKATNKRKIESALGSHHVRARNTWSKMIDRCTNPKNKDYKLYGGRGISVCDRWKSFKNFLDDMGDPPDKTSIDRWPDKNGNYEPGNCRWATATEQARNTRRNIFVKFKNEYKCIAEISEIINVPAPTLYSRYAKEKKRISDRIGGKK